MAKPRTKNPHFLVCGGAGFIGSTFTRMLLEKEMRVTVYDALTYAGPPENIKGLGKSCTLVPGDISDRQSLRRLLKGSDFTAIVNFAAESHVDRSIAGPKEFIRTNIQGTYALIESALEFQNELPTEDREKFRYLHVSTDEVFGELGDHGKFTENSPYQPNSPYSASKAAADHLVRAWVKTFSLQAIVTHCTNNYGPRQFPEKLIPLMITEALAGNPLPVYGRGLNVRDWIHVEDHCRGIFLALERGKVGDTYIFSGASERKNIDVVHALCDILDRLKPNKKGDSYREYITYVADRLGHDWRYAVDSTKAKTELNFKCHYEFSEGLEHTVKWYLENTSWCKNVLKRAKDHHQRKHL